MTPDPIPASREFFPVVLVTRGDLETVCQMYLAENEEEGDPFMYPSDETKKALATLPDELMEEIALAMQKEAAGMFYEHLYRAAIPLLKEYGVIE